MLNALVYSRKPSQWPVPHSLDPYIEHICSRLAYDLSQTSAKQEDRARFFAEVVKYFTKNPHKTVASFLSETKGVIREIFPLGSMDESLWLQRLVGVTVLCISLWATRESISTAFGDWEDRDRFVNQFAKNKEDSEREKTLSKLDSGDFNIKTFARIAGLIPEVESWVTARDANPREEIRKSKLNAKLVRRVGRIKIKWTFDVSEHFKFSGKVLWLFCMPSKLVIDNELGGKDSPERALE